VRERTAPGSARTTAEGNQQVADLISLIYVSTATHLLSAAELVRLMARAPHRNERAGVTGVLLYNDGHFMQYLEGPAEGLSKIYKIIKADRLHRGLIELIRTPIKKREFEQWPMAFHAVDTSDLSLTKSPQTLLQEKLAPSSSPAPMGRMLLSAFSSQRLRHSR